MGISEKIIILLVKRGNISENLYGRMKRDNFTDKDLHRIAKALNCTLKATFILSDTGEEI